METSMTTVKATAAIERTTAISAKRMEKLLVRLSHCIDFMLLANLYTQEWKSKTAPGSLLGRYCATLRVRCSSRIFDFARLMKRLNGRRFGAFGRGWGLTLQR